MRTTTELKKRIFISGWMVGAKLTKNVNKKTEAIFTPIEKNFRNQQLGFVCTPSHIRL